MVDKLEVNFLKNSNFKISTVWFCVGLYFLSFFTMCNSGLCFTSKNSCMTQSKIECICCHPKHIDNFASSRLSVKNPDCNCKKNLKSLAGKEPTITPYELNLSNIETAAVNLSGYVDLKRFQIKDIGLRPPPDLYLATNLNLKAIRTIVLLI